MTEEEFALQATADLSPVSPAPVHAAPSLAVPALQDTVDTINAMVAAALDPSHTADEVAVDPELVSDGDAKDEVVDDDSLDDPYAESTEENGDQAQPEKTEDVTDDYAKEFDSPIASDNEDNDTTSEEDQSPDQDQTNEGGDASSAEVAADAGLTSGAGAQKQLETSEQTEQTGAGQDEDSESADRPHVSGESSTAQAVPGVTDDNQKTSLADIHKLMSDLTSPPADAPSTSGVGAAPAPNEPANGSSATPSTALPVSSSLPPRPPISQNISSHPEQHHPGQTSAPVAGSTSPSFPPGASAPSHGGFSSLPQPSAHGAAPGTTQASSTFQSQSLGYAQEAARDDDYNQKWEQFVADERQYMTEAKWDRFPEGSRIFIGNLSSDKVSKRDVFDEFHRFGRLAQISLKSAYGFVQYHTVEEGHAAVAAMEGAEIKGRRIHLEISRLQDKGKKDRARSPDRSRGRDSGREGSRDFGRRNDKFGQGRDRYGREPSPPQNNYHNRDDKFSRNRGSWDGGRNRRSRSPGYSRNERDQYRRRSPSPYGRSRGGDNELDLPARYGADVPDVQIILQPDVNRDFANWVEMALKGKNLKTEVMFLHPRMPKDQVIQRQVAEGVHAVVDLDLRAQSLGKVSFRAFDRSAGLNNVRFDQYVDIDPPTAGELILRAKASGAARYGQQQYGSTGGYNQGYGSHQAPSGQGYHPPPQAPNSYPPQPAATNPADLAALMGQLDPASLQQLVASLQTPAPGGHQSGHAAPAQQLGGLDLQAILGSLGGQQAAPQAPQQPQGQYHTGYGAPQAAHPAAPPANGAPTGGDAAAQVQNIMASLARYR